MTQDKTTVGGERKTHKPEEGREIIAVGGEPIKTAEKPKFDSGYGNEEENKNEKCCRYQTRWI